MRALVTTGALALAVVAQSLLGGLTWRGVPSFDLVLVLVVYIALSGGPAAGIVAGTTGGLVQDALSSGILGIGGLAKTVVGFLAGRLGTQFIVTATLPRLFMFAAATAVHALIFMGVYAALGLRSFPNPWNAIAVQAVGNGLLGVLVFAVADRLPRLVERRRGARGSRVDR